MALVTNNISGSSEGSSRIGITGSVIFANEPGDEFPPMPGTDVTFFVSGSTTERSVFGGTTVVSGTLFVDGDTYIGDNSGDMLVVSASVDILCDSLEMTGTISATGGISGSLTRLTDGSSYIVAGNSVTVTSASNGQVTISAQPSLAYFASPSAGILNSTGSLAMVGNEGITSPQNKGTDVFFYVSGSSSTNEGKSLFGGDVVVSGSFVATGFEVLGDSLEVTGTVSATGGISGSLTRLTDGKSYLVAGSNITIITSSTGQVLVSSDGGAPGGSTGQVQFNSSGVFTGDAGLTYTSGTLSVANLQVTGSSAVISGDAFEMTGSLTVTGGISGSLTHLSNGTSYLVASGAVQITSASNGAVTVYAPSQSSLLSVTNVNTSPTYNVSASDQVVVFMVNDVTGVLPHSAAVGTNIVFKDMTGNAGSVGPQELSSSVGNIDGSSAVKLPSVNYSSLTVIKIEASPERWIIV